MMRLSCSLFALTVFLSACSPAETPEPEAPVTPVPEAEAEAGIVEVTEPVSPDDAAFETLDVEASPEPADIVDATAEPVADDTELTEKPEDHSHDPAEHSHDHDEDHKHDHDHDHSHDNDHKHDHSHDHDEDHDDSHDHAHDHSHDHDHDHSHGVGEAHVHGLADLSITREENRLIFVLDSPADNYGIPESSATMPESHSIDTSLFTIIGGACEAETSTASLQQKGDHASISLEAIYACSDVSGVTDIQVMAFVQYPGFEGIDAIYLDGATQVAAELTPSRPSLSLR